MRPLTRLGLVPRRVHLLTVSGRRTGRRWTTPVSVTSVGGERYLVAPYGERSWVKNARAADGVVELRRGRRRERVRLEEVTGEAAVPVLRRYWDQELVTRPFFGVTPKSGDEEWLAEAPRHPVFRLHR